MKINNNIIINYSFNNNGRYKRYENKERDTKWEYIMLKLTLEHFYLHVHLRITIDKILRYVNFFFHYETGTIIMIIVL